MKFQIFTLLFCVTAASLFSQSNPKKVFSCSDVTISEEWINEKAELNKGDYARLCKVFDKANRGEDIVIGAIGGSITMGALASEPEHRWVNLVAQWFRNKYPNINVSLCNAGIGATTSLFGALRVESDLLKYEPDLVFFEYSINDSKLENAGITSEGLIRKILKSKKQPPIIMLAMMDKKGLNAQEKHIPLAIHYQLPMLSLRNVLEPLILNSIIDPALVIADEVHPNDKGHEIASKVVINLLNKIYRDKDSISTKIPELPSPLFSDLYEFTKYVPLNDIVFSKNIGWKLTPHVVSQSEPWRMHGKHIIEEVLNATNEGSVLEYSYNGTFFSVIYYLYKNATVMGNIKITIDGVEYPQIKGTGEQTWGGLHRIAIMGEKLAFGKHKVIIQLIKGKDAVSVGNGFDIISFAYGTKR